LFFIFGEEMRPPGDAKEFPFLTLLVVAGEETDSFRPLRELLTPIGE